MSLRNMKEQKDSIGGKRDRSKVLTPETPSIIVK